MIRLSDARPADAPALARILGDWVAETDWMPRLHSAEEDARFLGHLIATQTVRVAWRGDQPQGFLSRAGAEISALYVARAARGQGIGARLLAGAMAEPRLTLWTFQANAGARRFYRRHGFVEIEQTSGEGNEERLPDVRLEWQRTMA